jgi:L-fuconolactonase
MSGMPGADAGLVDAHIHLWDTRAFTLPWLTAVPQLATRYTAAEFSEALADIRLHAAVAVQAGDSAAEATWLVSSPEAASAVGSAQIDVVLQYAPSLDRVQGPWHPVVFADGRAPKGVRLPVYDQPADWSTHRGVEQLVGYLEQRGLVLELLLRPDQLGGAGEVAAKHPRLAIVLCHLGIGEAEPDQGWRTEISRLAARENVAAKVSGLHTSRPPERKDHLRARRAAEWALEQWGPDRLMFGSDWPVSTRAGTYADVLEWTRCALGAATTSELQSILARTAVSVYDLSARDFEIQTISGKR